MGAARTKAAADLRRRRLQAVALAAVLGLAAASATLALSILAESRAPFDSAFTAANGAHLVITFRGDTDAAALTATAQSPAVTVAAGPWPVAPAGLGTGPTSKGNFVIGGLVSGRSAPTDAIDNVTVLAGRWWAAPGEAVLSQSSARLLGKGVGDTVTLQPGDIGKVEPVGPGGPQGTSTTVTVVGVAQSVSTPDVSVWASPTDVAALSPGTPPELEMLYRVRSPDTATGLSAAAAAIVGDLPPDAVASTTTWLDIKVGVDRIAQLYVPVLLSFSIFALLAAAFTITNIVSGVVLTSYRDIGVMKSIGFTPAQVSGILLSQILVPVTIGAVGGVVLGTLASQPILADTAESFGLPAVSTISIPVILVVILGAVGIATLAAIVPAIRAGRISAVAAIAHGRAPASPAGSTRRRLVGLRLPFGLPVRLGVASGLSHAPRAAMTLGALIVGVAAVTMAIGLNASLLRIKGDLDRGTASPVRAESPDSKDPGAVTASPARAESRNSTDPGAVTAAIATDPRTGRSVAIGETQVTVPRLGGVPFVGYDGDATWIGYGLIDGRWFSGPGEAVAPSNVFTQTGLHVGDATTLTLAGRTVTVRLVGEIFDSAPENRDNLVVRGTFADLRTLDPSATPDRWEIQPKAGVDPESYTEGLRTSVPGVQVYWEGASREDASFTLFLSVIGLMGIVLTVMSLGGVFNTVLLETRQRTREMAVLKTLGLTPNGVVTMVVSSIVPVALLAGLVGVPLGLLAQRAVLSYMGEVAAKTRIPPASFDVFPPLALLGLALSGLAIGAAGAFLPARRAARARIAPVLQAE